MELDIEIKKKHRELLNRFRILDVSQEGCSNHNNEISAVMERLKEANILI